MKHISFNGIDVLNSLTLSIYEFHKELLDPSNEEFVKLVRTYSNFVLGACSGLKKDDFDLCYDKLTLILKKVRSFFQ